jgi:hypothetical protein
MLLLARIPHLAAVMYMATGRLAGKCTYAGTMFEGLVYEIVFSPRDRRLIERNESRISACLLQQCVHKRSGSERVCGHLKINYLDIVAS